MQIIGQKANIDLIDKWAEMSPFTIIQGDKNTGKTTLLLYMCEKYKLKYVKLNNSVKDIRELIKLMTPNSNTVYHFKDFNKASIQAKNALLKITEEPIPGNYIVITGESQIKTLESRARKIVMNTYLLDEMIDFMKQYYEDETTRINLYRAGINTPTKVIKYSKYEAVVPLLEYAIDLFKKITYISDDDCVNTVARFDNKYDEIDACILFLDMLIHLIESDINSRYLFDYYDVLNVLVSAKESLESDHTLNRKLVLYRALYTISIMESKRQ